MRMIRLHNRRRPEKRPVLNLHAECLHSHEGKNEYPHLQQGTDKRDDRSYAVIPIYLPDRARMSRRILRQLLFEIAEMPGQIAQFQLVAVTLRCCGQEKAAQQGYKDENCQYCAA